MVPIIIIRAFKDLNKKANSMPCTFRSADPVVKTYLIKMYCLYLYDCHLWFLSKSLNAFQTAMNKILRKVWNFPFPSHSSIVHCTATIPAIHNTAFRRYNQFLSRSVLSHVPIVSSSESATRVTTRSLGNGFTLSLIDALSHPYSKDFAITIMILCNIRLTTSSSDLTTEG